MSGDGRNPGERWAEAETARTVGFSDGVFAIVVTLLAVDLRPPEAEPGELARGLLAQWPAYLAFVTSFVYVAVLWLNHKAAFKRIGRMSRGVHWSNLGILLVTTLLPFPTAVVAEAMQMSSVADVRTALGLYAIVGAMLCVSWLVFFAHLGRHPELLAEGVDQRFFARETRRAWAGVIGYALGGVLAYVAAPWVASVVFLGLPVFYGATFEGLYSDARRR